MPEKRIQESSLVALREVIRRELGLDIRPDSINSLPDKITDAAKELGYATPDECIRTLISRKLSKREIEVLASHLTVGETYFFRDSKTFSLLEEHVLPAIIRHRRRERSLRIWSAACATGEEPYSLAMLLMKVLPDWKEWHITVLATDINTHFLGKAIKGRYTKWSFRTTPKWAKQRFFTKISENSYEIDPLVRRLVSFSYLNLAENIYPSVHNNTNAMDLILCRNVLIYFGREMRRRVVAGMHRSLVDGGFLLVSPVEASRQLFGAFEQTTPGGVTLYCRSSMSPVKKHDAVLFREDTTTAKYELLQEPAVPAAPPSFFPQPETETQSGETVSSPQPKKDGNFHHAKYLFQLGRYQEATAELLKCPQETKVQLLLCRAYANLGDFEQAGHWCSRAIACNPLDAHARYLSASILQEQGLIREAIESLRHTIYLDQHFVLAHFSLAGLLVQSGNKEKAYKYFQNAYQMARQLPDQQIVPESGGMPAGRLAELIKLSTQTEYEK